MLRFHNIAVKFRHPPKGDFRIVYKDGSSFEFYASYGYCLDRYVTQKAKIDAVFQKVGTDFMKISH